MIFITNRGLSSWKRQLRWCHSVNVCLIRALREKHLRPVIFATAPWRSRLCNCDRRGDRRFSKR